jgi:hypothetical protein
VESINFRQEGKGRLPRQLSPAFDENLRLNERFNPTEGDVLVYEFTVSDPTLWTRPWTARIPMVKTDELVYEFACHEGNYGMTNMLAGARAEERVAGAPRR